ncbi:hypothetical protein GUITHDRAFT_144688 [Guillardia theta CCMP2712]|uniref:FHA domain-containing protein n=1 Tax=Guillardia theta (strain CCMP2712) TaxID=905079 RepID=L1IPQ9_GUITC|nr:hypothetical protein GUITHDRAFT_144688 [Guillardia theta CCMP2712]EKX37864.1 hypothetical protein GUITHDRAFT_144688 [Guillardia theta CCMP2712]|eukprot:XP_005824844.1 hypothetical protein GUITHDRAFT_144688 [Guillardia theta CCMP2712]
MALNSNQTFGGLSLVKKDGSKSQVFPLVEQRYIFGRADHCDIRINLLTVSREHAEISVDSDLQVWLKAMSTTSETVVSGKTIKSKEQVSEVEIKPKRDKTPLKECNLVKPRPQRFYATPTKDFSKMSDSSQDNRVHCARGENSAKVNLPAEFVEDKENTDSIQQSFSDDNVSLNTSASKSPLAIDAVSFEADQQSMASPLEVTSSQHSFPVPQVLVFGNTQKLDTGLLLNAKDNGKTISAPIMTPKKGVLKTPGSVSKRRSVCFIDGRNETAYLASASDDLDFVPGIIRVSSKVRPEEVANRKPATMMGEVNRKRSAVSTETSPNPRVTKKRKVESTDHDRIKLISSPNRGVHYIQMCNDGPAMLEIKDFFETASGKMYSDLIGVAIQGSKENSEIQSSKENLPSEQSRWMIDFAKTFIGKQALNDEQRDSICDHFDEASKFLFKKNIHQTDAKEKDILKICFENAKPSIPAKTAKNKRNRSTTLKKCITKKRKPIPAGPSQPNKEENSEGQRNSNNTLRTNTTFSANKHVKEQEDKPNSNKTFFDNNQHRKNKEDEASWAEEQYRSIAPQTAEKARRSRRSSAGAGEQEASKEEEASWAEEQSQSIAPQTAEKARRSRRSSAGAGEQEASKEEEASWAEEQYRSIAPQTAEKARRSRRSSAGAGEQEASKEEEASWAEEQYRSIAPQTAEKARRSRRSSAGAGEQEASKEEEASWAEEPYRSIAPQTAEKARRSRRSSAGAGEQEASKEEEASWAEEQYRSIAPQTAEKARRSRRSSAGAGEQEASKEEEASWAEEQNRSIAPQTAEKARRSRRSSAGAGEQEASKEEEASWAEEPNRSIAPQTAEKARRSRRSSAGAGEQEASKEEEASWAEEQYRSIAPQTAEKARRSRRSSAGAGEQEASKEEEASWAEEPNQSIAPQTAEKARRSRRSSVKCPVVVEVSSSSSCEDQAFVCASKGTKRGARLLVLESQSSVMSSRHRRSTRQSVLLSCSSPHVSIGPASEFLITPRKEFDWRSGLEDKPAEAKRGTRSKRKLSAVEDAPVEEEVKEVSAKPKTGGRKKMATVETQDIQENPSKKTKRTSAVVPQGVEAVPSSTKASRSKKAKDVPSEDKEQAAQPKASRASREPRQSKRVKEECAEPIEDKKEQPREVRSKKAGREASDKDKVEAPAARVGRRKKDVEAKEEEVAEEKEEPKRTSSRRTSAKQKKNDQSSSSARAQDAPSSEPPATKSRRKTAAGSGGEPEAPVSRRTRSRAI